MLVLVTLLMLILVEVLTIQVIEFRTVDRISYSNDTCSRIPGADLDRARNDLGGWAGK